MAVSEIVVGIDFGTTYSGVSWAVNGGKKNVRLITDWPNPQNDLASSEKVPTTISYKNGKPSTWGYNVETKEQTFRWFKLLLDPKHKFRGEAEPIQTSNRLLGTLNKTAEDVASDYLKLIWEYTKQDIKNLKGDDWDSIYELRAVLTVPAIWSPAAKDRTLRVAKNAGLPDSISLVTEPEAAALAVLKAKNDEDTTLKVGDAFVVCDAGGGTVDLISYKITGLDPLKMEECAVGDGGLCGAVFVDAAFEKHIKMLVGEQTYNSINERRRLRMLREFENAVKRCFSGDNKEYSVDLPGVEDDPDNGIDDGTIRIKPNMLKTVFDHVINQIVDLVEKQIDEVQERSITVKAILLVGGFGSNRYLSQRLKSAHRGDGIQVLQVAEAWSSICRGATLWGLENSENTKFTSEKKTVTARLARHSYGLTCDKPYDQTKHLAIDRVLHPDGMWRATNQMDWLLQKGERMEVGDTRSMQLATAVAGVGLFSTGLRDFSQVLFYSAADEPPARKNASVKDLCSVNYGIDCSKLWLENSYRDPATGKKWRDAVFDMGIILDSATLHFVVFYKGEAVAYTEAQYTDDS